MTADTRNTIGAERVVLRELLGGEAAQLAGGGPVPGPPCAVGYPLEGTLVAARMLVRLAAAGGYRAGFGMYQVVLRDGVDGSPGELVVGDAGFHAGPDGAGAVEIGYGLAPSHRGLGLATDAVRALAGWALAQPGVREVRAETEHDHRASQGVLLRAGFAPVPPPSGDMRRYVLRNGAGQG